MSDPSEASEVAEAAVPSIPPIPGTRCPDEAVEADAAKVPIPEPAPRPAPEFAWEIDQKGCLILPAVFFASLKVKKKTKCLPAEYFVKTAATHGFFDKTIVHPLSKDRVLSCMSISGDDVENWRSFVVNEGFRLMFDSFMRVVCDKRIVATANEAELPIDNGCKPKTFKEVAMCFFHREF